MSRKELAQQYLFSLVVKWEALEAERQELLAAATRITAIQNEKADLLSDAQDALAKYNQVFGTSYTLPQVRAWYNAGMKNMQPPLPIVIAPDVVGLTQAAATTAIQAAGLVVSVVQAGHDTVAAGLVINSVPTAGGSATAGSTMTIVVSTGPVTP